MQSIGIHEPKTFHLKDLKQKKLKATTFYNWQIVHWGFE